MNLKDIKSFYINLDYRNDRSEDIKNKLKKLGFEENNINRFSAVDGKNLKIDLENKNYMSDEIFELVKKINKIYKNTELAVLLSHYFLLKQILLDTNIKDDEYIFIFEDDFFINEDFLNKKPFKNVINELNNFVLENEWDIIFMGGRFDVNFTPNAVNSIKSFKKINLKNNPNNQNDNLEQEKSINKTNNFYLRRCKIDPKDWDRTLHNYIINKKSALKLCNFIKENYKKVNMFLQIDHLICSDPKNLKTFDYFPHIFYSPRNYNSDIQFSKLYINPSKYFNE